MKVGSLFSSSRIITVVLAVAVVLVLVATGYIGRGASWPTKTA